MSHRDTCPDQEDAEREGRRAFERGRTRRSNPYEGGYNDDENCPEAADAWRSGFRRAEIRAEEEREEQAARERADRQRAELEAEDLWGF